MFISSGKAQMRLLAVFLCLESTFAFKFLAYNPLFGSSHVNFMGKISDALVEAGHEVVSSFHPFVYFLPQL